MPLTEKKCSRCHRFSWDSTFGSYNETCTVDGKPCDNNGETYVDDSEH